MPLRGYVMRFRSIKSFGTSLQQSESHLLVLSPVISVLSSLQQPFLFGVSGSLIFYMLEKFMETTCFCQMRCSEKKDGFRKSQLMHRSF